NDLLFKKIKELISINNVLSILLEINEKKIMIDKIYISNDEIFLSICSYTVIDYLERKFYTLGYDINNSKGVLNASNFGVPQLRNRFFIIGIQNKKASFPRPILPEATFNIKDAIYDIKDLSCSYEIDEKPIMKKNINFKNPLSKYLNGSRELLFNHVI
ncbi:hypothetical protein CN514_25210, partial [Bacillus sp. AFS001701]|uniref:DNA cytosine methyltransferase n=1 Tax=Bacillus sp. AFS001701 TaxID=2033480 RepID=UPI000BFAEE4D